MKIGTRLVAAASLGLIVAICPLLVGARDARADDVHRITVDGRERTYQLHLPDSYDGTTPLPVVVALHGGGGNVAKARRGYRLEPLADRDGFIIVYPQGLDGHWNDGRAVQRIRSRLHG